jgi:hypothetical protein
LTDEEHESGSLCGEAHKAHLCYLKKHGLLNRIRDRQLTYSPRVSCSKCGIKAHYPHNVCFPVRLEE